MRIILFNGQTHEIQHKNHHRSLLPDQDDKLLGVEGRGVGDNFPKEDNIGWLYPLEKPELFRNGA
jgi:hypothetical protein